MGGSEALFIIFTMTDFVDFFEPSADGTVILLHFFPEGDALFW